MFTAVNSKIRNDYFAGSCGYFLVACARRYYHDSMDQVIQTDSGWRGSRDGWLEAGYQALIENGIDAVRILPLAKRLHLSRTSFYWFFSDRDTLLAALLERWERTSTAPLIAATTEYADSRSEAMFNVLACFLAETEFDPRLEFAVRSWGLQDADLSARLRAADAARITALQQMLMAWDVAELEADVRARTIYLTQIGYISMQMREDVETRLARCPSYVRIYVDEEPAPREIARFNARVRRAVGR